MNEREAVAGLQDRLLGLLQAQQESLLALRDEACEIRATISDPRLQKDLDWSFVKAGEELDRVRASHRRLGTTIRAPRALYSVK